MARARRRVVIEYHAKTRQATAAIGALIEETRSFTRESRAALRRLSSSWQLFSRTLQGVEAGINILTSTLGPAQREAIEYQRAWRRVDIALSNHNLTLAQSRGAIEAFARTQQQLGGILRGQTVQAFAEVAQRSVGLDMTLDQLIRRTRLAQDIMFAFGESAEQAALDLAEIATGEIEPLFQWVRGSRELVDQLNRIQDPAQRGAAAIAELERQLSGASREAGNFEIQTSRLEQAFNSFTTSLVSGADAAIGKLQEWGQAFASWNLSVDNALIEAGNEFDDFVVRVGNRIAEASRLLTPLERRLQALGNIGGDTAQVPRLLGGFIGPGVLPDDTADAVNAINHSLERTPELLVRPIEALGVLEQALYDARDASQEFFATFTGSLSLGATGQDQPLISKEKLTVEVLTPWQQTVQQMDGVWQSGLSSMTGSLTGFVGGAEAGFRQLGQSMLQSIGGSLQQLGIALIAGGAAAGPFGAPLLLLGIGAQVAAALLGRGGGGGAGARAAAAQTGVRAPLDQQQTETTVNYIVQAGMVFATRDALRRGISDLVDESEELGERRV